MIEMKCRNGHSSIIEAEKSRLGRGEIGEGCANNLCVAGGSGLDKDGVGERDG